MTHTCEPSTQEAEKEDYKSAWARRKTVCQNWIGMGVKKEKRGEGTKDTADRHTHTHTT